ncbi:MAG: helix-turn-helix domain-containing protein [Clostridiales bacterium]|nr:helix-turn-helix domain-containing protein [Clostridiales bacterium]
MERRKEKKHRVRFGKNSVFTSTLLTLLILFVCLLLITMFMINSVLVRAQQRRVQETNLQMLEQTSEMSELALQMLQSDLNELAWNDQMVRVMINPNQIDSNQSFEIFRLLENSFQANELIRGIWLYLPTEEKIFSSNGLICSLEEFADRDLIQNHVSTDMPSMPGEAAKVELLLEKERLFLIQDMVLTESIGCIYLEVDLDRLYEILDLTKTEDPVYLYDKNGDFIGTHQVRGSAPERMDFSQESLFLTETMQHHGEEEWYSAENEFLGWHFIRRMDVSSTGAEWKSAMPQLWMGILLFIGIGLAASYFITAKIYNPINHLVQLVLAQKRGQFPKNQSEMAYLELSFFQAIDEKKNMQETMNRFSQDILEQVFRKLLLGKSLQESGMMDLEESWKNPWLSGQRYQVIVCRKQASLDGVASAVDAQFYYLSICQVLESVDIPVKRIAVSMEYDVAAIVLCSDSHSMVQFKEMVQKLEQRIADAFQPSAYPVYIDHGKVYLTIEDIMYSWQEGLQKVNYLAYVRRSGMTEAEDSESLREHYYRELARHILDYTLKDQIQEAEELLSRVVKELITSEQSLEEKKTIYQKIQEVFLEKKMSLSGKAEKQWSLEEDDLDQINSAEELGHMMLSQIHGQMDQIGEETRKSSYVHVENAKRYIQQHYQNSDLGVQDVAEYLHLNMNYFSEIFNERAGESFSSYLNRLRIENACQLLTETTMSVKDVGFKCGFNTVQHFNRMFKKYTGVTPTKYREKTISL